jgi:predicted peroxiredoxin
VRNLVVQLTSDDPERVAAALTVGMTAAAAGASVALWLSGPATLLAVPGREPDVALPHAPDLTEALDTIDAVHVCSQCAARRGLTDADLRPGARIAGAGTLVESLLAPGAQAVTY